MIALLPIGIFAIIFDFTLKVGVTGELGGTFLTQLLQFGVTVTIITLLHGIIILPILAGIVTGQSPLALLKRATQPLLVAFSTSSSSATLPVSIKAAEEKLFVDKSVSSFVLPLGATMNMDGTALFEAVAAIFLAYLYGIELSTLMVITIFLMAMISSIGAPGMPTASMSGMQIVLLAAGIPLEAIAILLVIERTDFRTAVNVNGDLMGSVVVNHMMGAKIPNRRINCFNPILTDKHLSRLSKARILVPCSKIGAELQSVGDRIRCYPSSLISRIRISRAK